MLDPGLTLFCNLKIALVELGDSLKLIENRAFYLAHLVASIYYGKMILTVTARPIRTPALPT